MAERETSMRRGIDVLLVLGWPEAVQNGGLSVTRISELLGREKSQVSRSLKTLAESGLVNRDPDTLAYSVGWRIFALADRVSQQRLLNHGERVLEQLSASIGEQAYLSVLHTTEAVVLLSKASARSLQALTWVGRSYPAQSSATGRALLSEHDESTLRSLFGDAEFNGGGPRLIRTIDEFLERVRQVRETGYSISDDEFEEGLISVAAPVRDHRGRIAAAVNVSGPKFRLKDRLDEVISEVVAAADKMSSRAAEPEGTP